jgi:putative signal transducing protein
MENLSEKVFECTLAVEAHMVCDLLSQAGISARVDGEFLQSAMGEIPLGNAVKVRVDPARAAEAREVIAEWEKQQPVDPVAAPVAQTSRFTSSLWFLIGLLVGATLVFLHFHRTLTASDDYDRNHDQLVDARWVFDWHGSANLYEEDNAAYSPAPTSIAPAVAAS